MDHNVPKAALYYDPQSVSSIATLLALQEKGYGEDEVELKVVDAARGEEVLLPFLRISPTGTVPSLVVPLEKSLAAGIESRYKAVSGAKLIIKFLDKSRSTTSRTFTTSKAPAPALTPATIALSETCNNIIQILHSLSGNPVIPFFYSAFDDKSLNARASKVLPYLRGRLAGIEKAITENAAAEISASEKTRKLWAEQREFVQNMLNIYDKDGSKLGAEERKAVLEQFFSASNAEWSGHLKDTLTKLSSLVNGPLSLGDQLSIADLHLAPWLASIAILSGATLESNGDEAVMKIQERIGDNFELPKDFEVPVSAEMDAQTPGSKRAKLAAFWDEMKTKPSWGKMKGLEALA